MCLEKRRFVGMLVTLMLLIFFCVGCSEEQNEWSEKKHNRTEKFSYVFNYAATEKNGVDYAVDTKLDGLIEKDELINQIDEDVREIIKYTDLDIDTLSVFIVKSTLGDKTTIDEELNILYLPYAEIENLDYYDDLIRVITKIDSNWKIHGLSKLIFDVDGNPDRVISDFENGENSEVLYLSGASFLKGWNSEEEIEIAKNLATCVTHHALEQIEIEEFCKLSTNYLVRDYLDTLGIDGKLNDEKGEILDKYYFTSDETYEAKANSEQMKFFFTTTYENISDSTMINEFIINAEQGNDEIYKFLSKNYISMDFILEEQELPTIYVGNFGDDAASFCMSDGVYINVKGGLTSVFHELGHYYSNASYDSQTKSMENEGFAEYISDVVAQDYFAYGEEKLKYYNLLKNGPFEDSLPHELAYYEWYYNTYDDLQRYEEYNMREVIDFVAYRLIYYPDDFKGYFSEITLKEWGYGGEHVDMTYAEAESFIAYLIDQSSVDLVVKYLNEPVSYEECFGKNYETLFSDWRLSLNKYTN